MDSIEFKTGPYDDQLVFYFQDKCLSSANHAPEFRQTDIVFYLISSVAGAEKY